MIRGKNVLKWLIIATALLVVQTITFLVFGVKQLEGKLLPEHFRMSHQADTAYVRDFAVSIDPTIELYVSHQLRNDEAKLKEKLGVKVIIFEKDGNPAIRQEPEKKYNLAYLTWASRPDWTDLLFRFYTMEQTEYLFVQKEREYRRVVTYQWVLFFWLKRFEFIESSVICANS